MHPDCLTGRNCVFVSKLIGAIYKGRLILLHESKLLKQLVRMPEIIRIKKCDVPPTSLCNARITCFGCTLILLFQNQPDTSFRNSFLFITIDCRLDHFRTAISGAIIHKQKFPVLIRLINHCFNGLFDIVCCIVHRHNNTDHIKTSKFSIIYIFHCF